MILALVTILALAANAFCNRQQIRLQTTQCAVKSNYSLDLSQYMGIWYEIGATLVPRQFMEKGCSCNYANYTLVGDLVDVQNSCIRNGSPSIARGTASQLNKSRPGDLTVSFPGRPVSGPNYIVVNQWSNNSLTLVGDPCQAYFWLLSRDREISTGIVAEALDYAKTMGYNPEILGFQLTKQYSC